MKQKFSNKCEGFTILEKSFHNTVLCLCQKHLAFCTNVGLMRRGGTVFNRQPYVGCTPHLLPFLAITLIKLTVINVLHEINYGNKQWFSGRLTMYSNYTARNGQVAASLLQACCLAVIKPILRTLRFIGRQRDGNGKRTLYDMCL